MVEKSNLTEMSSKDLGEILDQAMNRVENLMHTAGDKFKQSESEGWQESLYEEAMELMAEARKTLEDTGYIVAELEARYGQSALYGDPQLEVGAPWSFDQRWYRKDLTTSTVPQSRDIDDMLPQALENLLSLVPSSWWSHQNSLVTEEHRKAVLQPLLLCGRERWPMGFPGLHKFANYLISAKDHLGKEPFLDTYTALRAIAPICTLGLSLEVLKEVKGADSKLRALCRGPSAETDSTIYELLVAAAFARMGHDVAFIEETGREKTPDLRLHGTGVPTVIECKRKQPLNDYESKEFAIMRRVFDTVCAERKKLGLVGELAIDFKQEISGLSASNIVEDVRGIANSLSPYASKEAEWGTIHLRPVEVSQEFERTRLYSPEFLGKVFGTDLEMDEFDGICAVAENNSYPEVERAELPFLLKWTSSSTAALARKLQTIRNLWVEAVDQIPTGEMGLIYLAYEEGHRPSLADARTDAVRELATTVYFKGRPIVVAMTVISRLFPNVTHEGRPDFIESTIPLAGGGWDNYNYWTQEMPTRVFTF